MRVDIFSCLLAFVLSCNVTAEITQRIILEKQPVTLPCPHSVGKVKVTWSRDVNGNKENILIVDGDRDIRLINKPYKHFGSLADKSLHIVRADVSDAATYFCDNEPAAQLRVISSVADNC